MPVPSLPTELLEDIVNIVCDGFTIVGDVWDFAKNITLVNRRWTPIGRRLLWQQLALAMEWNHSLHFKRHLDLYPHLAELVETVTFFRVDPNYPAEAVNWEASEMDSLLEIVRRCQNLTTLNCHFIPDNGGHGFGDPADNIEKPFYTLFEATSKLPKLEQLEIFWPNVTLEHFASILVPGFPALQNLKLSIGEFSGHELDSYDDYDPETEVFAAIVPSPVEVLTVTLGGEPTAMCRILRQAIDPSTLTELYVYGNAISRYDDFAPWVASFPRLERFSLRLRGAAQQEVLPALSTALASLEHLEAVMIRRNYDKWDNSQSQGGHYWSSVNLKDLLARMPPQCTLFVLEGLVFPSRQIEEEFASFRNSPSTPDSDGWFLSQMVCADRSVESFHMLLYDGPPLPNPEWCWFKDVSPGISLIMLCSALATEISDVHRAQTFDPRWRRLYLATSIRSTSISASSSART